MSVQQSLFLNAFLLIEMAKVVLRGILAPRFGALRLVPMTDETARYWYFWSARLIGFLGYGLLLVVPIVNANISFVVGRSLRLLIVFAAAVAAVIPGADEPAPRPWRAGKPPRPPAGRPDRPAAGGAGQGVAPAGGALHRRG